ncbi:helix-turn-helix transcriptional regulator [Streptomyces sp. NPDC048737]|uniref:helix-turn-helix domain-containing protein n=1 Tax=unclassified Streptomyces TaxID=2593676 RepID=UPI00342027BE
MVRTPLTPEERERGERLGALLREARGGRSMAVIAAGAGISAETLRKIETGRAPTPAFFTVAALARALGLSMDELAARCALVAVPRVGAADAGDAADTVGRVGRVA